ncbi:MAG: ATP-binding protein [Ruminococcaceae bacterium]|nr:ATP-binding protein [Oscillospiraceae bacterium]
MKGRIHLLCGRLCCGKSTYARQLAAREKGVILSSDELMLMLELDELLKGCGDVHALMTPKVTAYLFKKAEEIAAAGTDVVIDLGFWQRAERQRISEMLREHGVDFLWHYISVSDEDWKAFIERRNLSGEGYTIDEGLMEKFLGLFEPPEREEMDVWHENRLMD